MHNGFDLNNAQSTTAGRTAESLSQGLVNFWLPVVAPKPLHTMCQEVGRDGENRKGKCALETAQTAPRIPRLDFYDME